MDTSLIGRAKELQVAGLLVSEGIYVYYPLVDVGFDLVASNAAGTLFIPVQVKFKETRTGFALKRGDAEQFVVSEAVLAFGTASQTEGLSDFWFIPAVMWRENVKDTGRADDKLVAYFSDGTEWAARYKGRDGLRAAFAQLLR